MDEWPFALPSPLWDYEFEYMNGVAGGIAPRRNRWHADKKMSVAFVLTEGRLKIFRAFYRRVGGAFFEARWLKKAGFPGQVCRFVGDIKIKPLGKGQWKLFVTLEVSTFSYFKET